MLANIQRMQMKTKRAHLQNKRINQRLRDAEAPVFSQRKAQRVKVVKKLIDRAVGLEHACELLLALRKCVRCDGKRRVRRAAMRAASVLECALYAGLEADHKTPVILEFVLLAEDLRFRRVDLGHIGPQPLEERAADGALLGAGCKQVDDLL